MQDRLTSGLVAGIIASIPMNILDWGGFIMGIHEERLLDWASVVTMGRLPLTPFEVIFAQAVQVLFCGFLGIGFAFILPQIGTAYYSLKGVIYGIMVWFVIYALALASQLPALEGHTFLSVVSSFVSSAIFGLVLAVSFNYLINRAPG